MDDRLYRSRTDRVLAGVSGGLAERYDLDPSLVRIAWVVLVFLTGGLALVVYIVMAFVVPEGPPGAAAGEPTGAVVDGEPGSPATAVGTRPRRRRTGGSGPGGSLVLGLLLILVGAWFLLRRVIPELDLGLIWPVLAIGAGVLLVLLALAPRRQP